METETGTESVRRRRLSGSPDEPGKLLELQKRLGELGYMPSEPRIEAVQYFGSTRAAGQIVTVSYPQSGPSRCPEIRWTPEGGGPEARMQVTRDADVTGPPGLLQALGLNRIGSQNLSTTVYRAGRADAFVALKLTLTQTLGVFAETVASGPNLAAARAVIDEAEAELGLEDCPVDDRPFHGLLLALN